MPGLRYQPQGRSVVNLAHPLAQGLVAAIIPRTLAPLNLATGAHLAPSGLIAHTAGPHGLQLTTSGAGAVLALDISSNGAFTFLAIAKPADLGTFRALIGIGGQSGGLVLNGSAWSLSNGLAHSLTLPARSDRHQVVVAKRDSAGLRYIAVDGRITAASADSTTRLVGPVNLLCRNNQTDSVFKGDVALLLGWSRDLSSEEIRDLSTNPWQLFTDPDEDDDFFSPVRVDSSIAVTRASLLLTGGEVSMHVSRRLGAQPASGSISGGDVALRAARKLGVQPASLNASGGDATLRAARRLTVAPVEMTVAGGSIQFAYTPAPAPGSYAIAVTPAALAITGGEVRMRVTRRLRVEPAHFALIARQVDFRDSLTGAFIDAAVVPAARTIVFAGGKRTVIFNGGTRVVEFSGGIRTVRF